jgi:protein O-GlcNAc transferase
MTPDFQKIADLFQLEPDTTNDPVVSEARKLKGRTPEESGELAKISLGAGDYETAIKHFKTAIEQRGSVDPAIAVDLGAAYEYGDQMPQAYRRYQEALKLKETESEARLGLADLYKRVGRAQDSLQSLEALIENEPANPFYRIKLAETLRELGYPKRALTAAQEAVIVKPDESFYHYWIGDLLIQLGQYEAALESLRAAIEMSPGDDFLYIRVAVAFWRLDKKTEAVKAIRMASDLDPDKNVYHGLLESMLDEAGLTEEADLESERADKMDPYDHEMVRRTLGEMGIEAE